MIKLMDIMEVIGLVLATISAVSLVVMVGSVIAGLNAVVPSLYVATAAFALLAVAVFGVNVAINFSSKN